MDNYSKAPWHCQCLIQSQHTRNYESFLQTPSLSLHSPLPPSQPLVLNSSRLPELWTIHFLLSEHPYGSFPFTAKLPFPRWLTLWSLQSYTSSHPILQLLRVAGGLTRLYRLLLVWPRNLKAASGVARRYFFLLSLFNFLSHSLSNDSKALSL